MCEELKGERNTLVRKIEDIEPRYKGIVEECERLIALNAKQETKILELNSAAQAKVSELEKDLEKSELGVAKVGDVEYWSPTLTNATTAASRHYSPVSEETGQGVSEEDGRETKTRTKH